MSTLHKKAITGAIFAIIASVCTYFKVNTLLGITPAAFSCSHCFAPLVGYFGGALGVATFFCIRTSVKALIHSSYAHIILALHIPTLCGGLYWSSMYTCRRYMYYFAPLVCLFCIALFCLHPVGSLARTYTLYWFIPCATALLPHRSRFLDALGSTFTAHAVGSTLWLYSGLIAEPMTWMALIPVVACERLLFAGSMTLVSHTVTWLSSKTSPTSRAIALRIQGQHT